MLGANGMIDVKEYLERIQDINDRLIDIEDEIEQWKIIATKTTAQVETVRIDGELHAVDKVQSSGSGDTMATAVCNYTDLEQELGAERAELMEERQDIISHIKALPAKEYRLLRLMYVGTVVRRGAAEEIVYMSLKQAAYEMGSSRRTASRIYGRATARLGRMLEKEETYGCDVNPADD